ncbi:MAG TPA: hypothetical protein VI933_02300 [archaeon]|nr:hypothetical protein [archaeon]
MLFVSRETAKARLRELRARYDNSGEFPAEAVTVQICPVGHPEYPRVRDRVERFLDEAVQRGEVRVSEDDIGFGTMRFYS